MFVVINKNVFEEMFRTILSLSGALDGAAVEVLSLENHVPENLQDKVNTLGSSLQCYSLLAQHLGGDIERLKLWVEAKGIEESHKLPDLYEQLRIRKKF